MLLLVFVCVLLLLGAEFRPDHEHDDGAEKYKRHQAEADNRQDSDALGCDGLFNAVKLLGKSVRLHPRSVDQLVHGDSLLFRINGIVVAPEIVDRASRVELVRRRILCATILDLVPVRQLFGFRRLVKLSP